MVKLPTKRVAILVHGFAGKTSFMKEIEEIFKDPPYSQVYYRVSNISYYDSKHGLDFSKPYDLQTPIFDETNKQTLAHNFFNKITAEIFDYEEDVFLDIFAHSMGGLVTRAMIKYLVTDNKPKNWINNGLIQNVFLIGTPNHGTRLAQRMVTIPADIILSGLNFALEMPKHGFSSEWNILDSQFMQMVPDSSFLRELNEIIRNIDNDINWVTVRGLNSTGMFGIVWQPFIFRKFWIDSHFPFIHKGMIPNDGLVEAKSVPLSFATNITVLTASHMDLIKWKSKKPGKRVLELLKPIILSSGKTK
jgi:hypothetical protein